jgi:hypothetical protein
MRFAAWKGNSLTESDRVCRRLETQVIVGLIKSFTKLLREKRSQNGKIWMDEKGSSKNGTAKGSPHDPLVASIAGGFNEPNRSQLLHDAVGFEDIREAL